jgi:spermidine synthase
MSRRRPGQEVLATAGELVVRRDPRRTTGRLLLQGDMEASYVDLADPRHLEFDYLRRMRDVIEAIGARRVVHIGGGGCALPRALASADPGSRQEVVEIDPAVLALAREHLGLRRMPGLRVRQADGRAHLAARADASAEAIVIDAFVGARVPRSLADVEALAEARRALTPAGALTINVIDGPPLAISRAIAAGLQQVFAVVTALGPGAVLHHRRWGNVVLVASDGPLPLQRLRTRAAADPSPATLLEPAELARLTSGVLPW